MMGNLGHILHPPIVVFQMGKVGSTTLMSTLSPLHRGTVVQAHTFEGMSPEHRRFLNWRKRLKLPVLVICPIRDPLSRNISAFFQNFKRDTGLNFSDREWNVSELKKLFLQNYPHNVCLEWFDRHMRTVFGIDVFAEPFPIERKWKVYKNGSVQLLVYRVDLARSEQLKIISQFIGYRVENWCYSNVAADKDYGDLYNQFCGSVTLPKIYVDIMCNSAFCSNFWNEKEVVALAKKWTETL